jgi:hypothetical protein
MLSVVKTLPAPQNASPLPRSQGKKNSQESVASKSSSNYDEDCSRQQISSPHEFPSWDSEFDQTGVVQTPKRRDSKEKKDANHRPSTPSFGKHNSDQKDNFLGRPAHQWATSDFVEWDDTFADMPMDDIHTKSNVTIDVKPLPKLRLDLMPAPREEDEDNISAI